MFSQIVEKKFSGKKYLISSYVRFFVIFFFTSQAQLSADETVCMKCQELFGWEYKYSSDGYVWLLQFDLVYKGCSFSIFKVVLEK